MKPEYDMTGARRATEIEHLNRLRAGKTRITIMLDDDVLESFRRSEGKGDGFICARQQGDELLQRPSQPID